MDHLFNEPTFTASITYACCNHNAPAIPSGGLWVLEPSAHLWGLMDEQMRLGEPVYDGASGLPVLDANGKQTYQEWRLVRGSGGGRSGGAAVVEAGGRSAALPTRAVAPSPPAHRVARPFVYLPAGRHGDRAAGV
jgi:hypothetical protein